MAYVVSALWRAKEGCEGRVAEIIGELLAPSRAEPGCLFPRLLESRERAFYVTLD